MFKSSVVSRVSRRPASFTSLKGVLAVICVSATFALGNGAHGPCIPAHKTLNYPSPCDGARYETAIPGSCGSTNTTQPCHNGGTTAIVLIEKIFNVDANGHCVATDAGGANSTPNVADCYTGS